MLGVESSKSFIRDPQVLAFVETLDKPVGPRPQLVNVMNFKKGDDNGAW
jgi:uncharacterized protein (DUF1778 family)